MLLSDSLLPQGEGRDGALADSNDCPTGIVAGGVSSKGPYLILPNRGMTPVAQVGFT